MEPMRGWNQYASALNKQTEERLFTRWVNGYQMTMPFDEFKRKAGYGPKAEETTEADALEKVRRILDGTF